MEADLRKVYVTKFPERAPKGAKLITTKRGAIYYDTDHLEPVKDNPLKKVKRLYLKEGVSYPDHEIKQTKTGRKYIEYEGSKPKPVKQSFTSITDVSKYLYTVVDPINGTTIYNQLMRNNLDKSNSINLAFELRNMGLFSTNTDIPVNILHTRTSMTDPEYYTIYHPKYQVISLDPEEFTSKFGSMTGDGVVTDGSGNVLSVVVDNMVIQSQRTATRQCTLQALPYIVAKQHREDPNVSHPLPKDLDEALIRNVYINRMMEGNAKLNPSTLYKEVFGIDSTKDIIVNLVCQVLLGAENADDVYKAMVQGHGWKNPAKWFYDQTARLYPDAPQLPAIKKAFLAKDGFHDIYVKAKDGIQNYRYAKLQIAKDDRIHRTQPEQLDMGINIFQNPWEPGYYTSLGVVGSVIITSTPTTVKSGSLYKILYDGKKNIVSVRPGFDRLNRDAQQSILMKAFGDIWYEHLKNTKALPQLDPEIFGATAKEQKALFIKAFSDMPLKDTISLEGNDKVRSEFVHNLIYDPLYAHKMRCYINPNGVSNRNAVDQVVKKYKSERERVNRIKVLRKRLEGEKAALKAAEDLYRKELRYVSEVIRPQDMMVTEHPRVKPLYDDYLEKRSMVDTTLSRLNKDTGVSVNEELIASKKQEVLSLSEKVNAIQMEYMHKVSAICEATGKDLDEVLNNKAYPELAPLMDQYMSMSDQYNKLKNEYNQLMPDFDYIETTMPSVVEKMIQRPIPSKAPIVHNIDTVGNYRLQGYLPVDKELSVKERVGVVQKWFQHYVNDAIWKDIEFKIVTNDKNRAHCRNIDKRTNFIALRKLGDLPDVYVHEFGHAIEYRNDAVHNALLAFYRARTHGQDNEKLADILPNSGYEDYEITRRDSFPDPYCGKDYGGYATELLSMGLQFMYDDPVQFIKKDPEYFNLIYDIMSGVIV